MQFNARKDMAQWTQYAQLLTIGLRALYNAVRDYVRTIPLAFLVEETKNLVKNGYPTKSLYFVFNLSGEWGIFIGHII